VTRCTGERREAAPAIRVALGGAEDLVPFVGLLEAAASWLWQRGIHQWEPGSMRAQSPILSRFAQSSGLVVARSAAGLAGGCCLVSDPAPEWAGRAGDALYLHKLVVARPYAGQGLAHRLLAFCEERARAGAIVRLRLDCWDGNAKLRAFYRAAGFRELEAVPSFGYSVRLFERELE
jgi:GNAT superfamily N-acetyltransferase